MSEFRDRTFTAKEASDYVGITYRQLDYWARTDLVRPSVVDAEGSGSRRRYSYQDLVALRIVHDFVEAGMRLGTIRQSFQFIRNQLGRHDVAKTVLAYTGSTWIIMHASDELYDMLQPGQGVLNLLPLGGIVHELDDCLDVDRPPKFTPARFATPEDLQVA